MRTNWPLATIESLCTRVTSGGTPSRSNPEYYENGTIPWIKTGELKDWYVDVIQEMITEVALRESSAKLFPMSTVLLAMYGDGKTMGSVGLLRKPCATNQACCAMLPDPTRCDPKFLLYSLIYFRPALLKLTIAGAQRNLNGATIKKFKIGAPDLPTQHRIASILSAYDDLIENNTRRIAILEEMARRIYEEWFVHFRFPGHEHVKLVESELGLIPEGWSRVTLGEVAKVQWGDTSLTKASYVEQGYVAFSASGPDGFLPHFQRDGCGIVLSAIGAQCGKTWLARGQWGTIKNTISLWSHDEAQISNEYLYLQCSGASYWPRRGAAQPFISLGDARNCPVLKPTREVMAIFSQVMSSKFQLIAFLERKNTNLRTTRDLLLPKLISGELDVSTLPLTDKDFA